MVFHNPWGLIALVSIPVILGLHFFRSHRKTRRIGGLHLWRFAPARMPIGRKFTRLFRNLSLLFQLLAAILLSLLLAGMDLPERDTARHFTVILDDSISMTAGVKSSAAGRVKTAFLEWAKPKDKFTVALSSLRPRVLAGPFASKDEVTQALNGWTPASPASHLESAINLASKFLTENEKILFLTDSAAPTTAYAKALEVHAEGRPLENAAIDYADRVRVALGKDKVFLTLRAYSGAERSCKIQARAEGQTIFEQEVALAPDKPLSVSFITTACDHPIELLLPEDALSADNRAVLAPVPPRSVFVYIADEDAATEFFRRAVEAVPYARVSSDPAVANLVFLNTRNFPLAETESADETSTATESAAPGPAPAPSRGPVPEPEHSGLQELYPLASVLCFLPEPEIGAEPRLAQGRDLLLDHQNVIVNALPLEGVLWPYFETEKIAGFSTLIAFREQPLLQAGRVSEFQERYYLNLLRDRTNIFRTTAWPVLVQGLVEACRDAMPGMARTNYRVGEVVGLSVREENDPAARYTILRDGTPDPAFTDMKEIPRVLTGLGAGLYEIRTGAKTLARFSVNLFAPEESDLRGLSARKADFEKLVPASVTEARTNSLLFILVFFLTAVLTGLSWVFQDISR